MLYLGLDPGANGGIAVVDLHGGLVALLPLHETVDELVGYLTQVGAAHRGELRAFLEHVWTTGYGHGGDFKLGRSFGRLEAALSAAAIPHQLVLPKKWQQEFSIAYPQGASSSAKKTLTKATAQRLFPGVPITHATADALLLAEYCRRFHRRIGHGEEEARPRSHQADRTGQSEAGRQASSAKGAEGRAGRAARHGAGSAHPARRVVHVNR